jgi:hypothetical protein
VEFVGRAGQLSGWILIKSSSLIYGRAEIVLVSYLHRSLVQYMYISDKRAALIQV